MFGSFKVLGFAMIAGLLVGCAGTSDDAGTGTGKVAETLSQEEKAAAEQEKNATGRELEHAAGAAHEHAHPDGTPDCDKAALHAHLLDPHNVPRPPNCEHHGATQAHEGEAAGEAAEHDPVHASHEHAHHDGTPDCDKAALDAHLLDPQNVPRPPNCEHHGATQAHDAQDAGHTS